mmetsp:Transcript_10917/g.26226  ORF Transcript_10917/g.26226 Transcript_10917/m.26226 type:complete len:204 (-) Transcript_10917:2485-3096(-)
MELSPGVGVSPNAWQIAALTCWTFHRRSILKSFSSARLNWAGQCARAASSGRSSLFAISGSFETACGRIGPQCPFATIPSTHNGCLLSCNRTVTSTEFASCADKSATVAIGYTGGTSLSIGTSLSSANGVFCQMMASPENNCSSFTGRATFRCCRSRSLNSSQQSHVPAFCGGATSCFSTRLWRRSRIHPSVTMLDSVSWLDM